ncbi:MAG: glycoside hydrolase family 5 protein, partial [Gemmatales bacterium]|nr:glycoside hydrolase family 5 protein [Gemmatales bacterium]MDW8388132.1 cellulase family glycosylhydrolase [Gemmatales bacterium]
DHDERGRLLEDYWEAEWAKVEEDFAEMRALGANCVRIHLQFGKFIDGIDKPNEAALRQLDKLLRLAERQGLYLDLTGLGCYHKKDVPAWYDALDEAGRWQAQCQFWTAVARRAAASPAVFCYDLMNEPVVPGGKREAGEWLGSPFGGKHFVQFITLNQEHRSRPDIARAWARQLVQAIRQVDRRHLITVGLVDWSLDRPGLTSGFIPEKIVPELDFVAVHIYPHKGKINEALETLRGFAVGKPVVIEESFPLWCTADDLEKFVKQSQQWASGWFFFYWGRTPEELARDKDIGSAMQRAWLERFRQLAPQFAKPAKQ